MRDDRPTTADAEAAAAVLRALWRALAENDDSAALQLTISEIHEQIGSGEGVAERLSEAFNVDAERAQWIGVSSTVRVVDGAMVFMCIEVEPDKGYRIVGEWGPVRAQGWALYVAVEDGRWRVASTYEQPPDGWPPSISILRTRLVAAGRSSDRLDS